MVIYLAGLAGHFDRTYYEAALVDGANQWQFFRNITWPLLWPTTFFIVAINVIAGFQLFDQIVVMTEWRSHPRHACARLLSLRHRLWRPDLWLWICAGGGPVLLDAQASPLFQFRFFQREIEY